MTSSLPSNPPGTVAELLRRRLREIKRSSKELADAVAVPARYIDDLIAGSRRPPLPGKTDIYAKMTSFLRLRRNDVVSCALAERAGAGPVAEPGVEVRGLLLALCEPGTARALGQRRGRRAGAELAGLLQRLLEIAQGAVRRALDDPIGMRLAAAERGSTYLEMRFKVLEFLDATADTLTPADLVEFLQPRITRWDVDLETGVLRVVLRASGHRGRAASTA